jgi:hypothetical protein
MNTRILRILVGVLLVLGIVAVGRATAAILEVGPAQTYTTIQSAVDAAVSGDEILVEAGTYVEQVLIDGKDLTLTGAGAGLTIIASPDTLQAFDTTTFDHYPVVGIKGATVDLADLTVDGAGKGNLNVRFMGIEFRNAGGSVTGVTITGVRDTPLGGVQHGVGLYAYNDDTVARSLTIDQVIVDDYQKNGMALVAEPGTPLTLAVTGCETTGAGPTDVIVQNGMEITGADVAATVTGNTVRDVAWDGETSTAAGLLLDLCSGTVSGNVLERAQTAIYATSAPVTIANNEILVTPVAGIGTGVQVSNTTPGYAKAARAHTLPVRLAQPFDTPRATPASRATIATAITGNTLQLDPAIVDNAGAYGVFAYNFQSFDDLEVTVDDNTFTGMEIATSARDLVPTDGTFALADYDNNVFNACDVGVDSTIPATVSAENCWWGAADGPGDVGPGSGAEVSANVDFEPFRTDVVNLVYDPDPLDLVEAAPTGTVVFDYTGGASDRIYGYSIDVQWDPAVAAATDVDASRPATGVFATAQPFIVQEVAAGHLRIDAAIGGAAPGTFADPLFQIAFAIAPGAVEGSETSYTVTVNDLRNGLNDPVAGLVPDADVEPEIRVDGAAPQITDVLVTDTTLPSVDWTRDGHAIEVQATVIEGDLATLTCDLTAFGGTVLALADATVAGDVYTWTLAATAGMGDGPVTATVTATDGLAQTASAGDAITADNTAPDALAGLLVAPGHEKIHLSWTEPTPDTGSPLQGVVFRYVTWSNSPAYAGPLPDPPADVDAGTLAGTGPQAGAAWDWAIAPRDVYVLSGFVVDLVGNASPLGETGAATNYWLGDVDADGFVDVPTDITALGDTYGLSSGDTGYNEDADVGPTFSGSPLGIPNPQFDGYRIQFEDLMIFALNYGEVDPLLEFAPGQVPAMRWFRLDATTWVLSLMQECAGLKGVNLAAELPDGVTARVTAGDVLGRQEAPVFLRNIDRNGLDAGLAVIGSGQAITGAGELIRVVTSAPVEDLQAKVSARDLGNRELLIDMPDATGAATPRAHQLAQNMPNPFNPQTEIAFALPQTERVHLAIYGVDGRLVRTLVDEERPAGQHSVTWHGRDDAGRVVATGTYFYALRAGDFRQVRKMTLVK